MDYLKMSPTEVRDLNNRADFVKAIKAVLKNKFPLVRFSVRGSTGTAYSWVIVRPLIEEASFEFRNTFSRDVREFLKPYDTQDSDPMTDYGGSGYKISVYR